LFADKKIENNKILLNHLVVIYNLALYLFKPELNLRVKTKTYTIIIECKDIISKVFFQIKSDFKVCKYLGEVFLFRIILTNFDRSRIG
jgi:hypothetical protein